MTTARITTPKDSEGLYDTVRPCCEGDGKCSKTGIPLADTVSAGDAKLFDSRYDAKYWVISYTYTYYCARYHAKMRG